MSNLSDLHGYRVPGHPNLQYWGNNGFIRVRIKVPSELVKHVGKTELVKGLGTPCVSEAVRRSHGIIGDFQTQIDAARPVDMRRVQIRHQPQALEFPNLSPATAAQIAALIAREHGISPVVRGVFGETAVAADPASWQSVPANEIAEPVADVIPLAGFTYEAGIALWVASHGQHPPAPESVDIYRAHLKRLFDRLGHDEMNRVTEDDIVSHPEILISGADGRKPCSNKTANNHLASIRAVFRVAKFKRKITTDPTIGTVKKLKVKKNAETDRKGFDREQHARIVAEALQLGTDDPRRWLWLLGACYGGRIGEFADATVAAVRTVAGHLCFDINQEFRCRWEGKPLPLKTEGSPRILPLHPALEPFGFLDYVARVREQNGPDSPLFPGLNLNRYGKRAKEASRQCMEWLRDELGIEDSRFVFHSTRHAIKTFLRGRVEDQVHDRITGHGDESVSAGYGETELAVLAAALAHIPMMGE